MLYIYLQLWYIFLRSSFTILKCWVGICFEILEIGHLVLNVHFPPWVAIQASRCAGRVNGILAVKNPGVSLRPSYENGGRMVPPGTITALLQDIPGE